MFSEISCNSNFSLPGLKKVPTEVKTTLGLFSQQSLKLKTGDTAGHTFLLSGTGHMAGHCTKMKECHGLLLPGLGIATTPSILTLVLPISSMTFTGWHTSNSLYGDRVTSQKCPLRKPCFISAKIRHLNVIFFFFNRFNGSKIYEEPIILRQHPALI